MNSITQLKLELIAQKQALEEKGVNVTISNINPSPAEITSAIKNIPSAPDMSVATATESDVLKGKTFFALDSNIRTGTFEGMNNQDIRDLFLYQTEQTNTNFVYVFPDDVTYVRPYIFCENPNKLTVEFALNTTHIGANCLFGVADATVTNLDKLSKLEVIGKYSLHKVKGIDLSKLPDSLKSVENYGLYDTYYGNKTLITPALTTLQAYSFASQNKVYLDGVDISKMQIATITSNCFTNVIAGGTLNLPPSTTLLAGNAFYNGSYEHIIFHENISSIGANCFATIDPQSAYNVIDFTFLSETVPTVGANCLGNASKRVGVKVYVPDQSFEAYYNTANLRQYQSMLHPMSEKE